MLSHILIFLNRITERPEGFFYNICSLLNLLPYKLVRKNPGQSGRKRRSRNRPVVRGNARKM